VLNLTQIFQLYFIIVVIIIIMEYFLIFYYKIFYKLITIDNMRNMRVSSDVECHCCDFSDAQQVCVFLILMQIRRKNYGN